MRLRALFVLTWLSGCAHAPPPRIEPAAPPDVRVTVTPIAREVIAAQLGAHLVRASEAGWVLACAQASPEARLDVAITSGGKPVPVVDGAKSLSEVTGERYPPDVKHWDLRTGNFPWPIHVLTAGVLTILTLHVEHTYTPPDAEQVRAAVPRALALQAFLGQACLRGHPLVIRRPAEDAPIELVVVAGNESASVRAQVALAPTGRLEDRLIGAGPLRPTALPGATVAQQTQKAVDRPCDETWSIGLRDGPCAAIAYARAGEISSFGLTLPEAPAGLGTPASSAAARPWWDSDPGYAHDPAASSLDASLPVGETITGGVAACTLGELRVPGEDTDHVHAEVKLGGKWWRAQAQHPVLPLLTLPRDGRLPIAFYDWDWLSGEDHLATLTLARHGAELSAVLGGPNRRLHVAMTCRLYDRPAVEAAFARAWIRGADALDALEQGPVQVRPEASDLGFRDAGLWASRARVTEAAALVGWDDPRVRPLLDREELAEQRFWRGVHESLEKLSSGDQPVILRKPDPDSLRVIDARLRCAGFPTCRVELTVENPRPKRDLAMDLYPARIVLSDGRAVEADHASAEIPPNGRATILLFPKDPLPPASRTAVPWRVILQGFRRLEIFPVKPGD